MKFSRSQIKIFFGIEKFLRFANSNFLGWKNFWGLLLKILKILHVVSLLHPKN